jgi:hypothetical protein
MALTHAFGYKAAMPAPRSRTHEEGLERLAHDLRGLFAAVTVNASIIRMTGDPTCEEAARRIQIAGEKMTPLFDEILQHIAARRTSST